VFVAAEKNAHRYGIGGAWSGGPFCFPGGLGGDTGFSVIVFFMMIFLGVESGLEVENSILPPKKFPTLEMVAAYGDTFLENAVLKVWLVFRCHRTQC